MLCSKCATNLPEGSEFCPKCGQRQSGAEDSVAPEFTPVTLGCRKCGAVLPADARFCLKCGQPVAVERPKPNTDSMPDLRPPETRRRSKNRRLRWLLVLLVVLTGFFWVLTSDNPIALGLQETAGFKQDRGVLDSQFTVGPHTFRDYKFALPEGSVNVALVGQFTSGDPQNSSRKEADPNDNGIEVYVLTEPAFTVWQNGYATSSLYDSGKVKDGNINVDVPAGAGIYYLVFSNKASPKTAKAVRASVLLRYKSWIPEGVRGLRRRVGDWFDW